MFVRLTRTMRLRAGQFVALVYLFCVLAPAASFAFAGGSAPCLTDPADAFGIHHVHEGHVHPHAAGADRHVHQDHHQQDHGHDHAAGHAHHGNTIAQSPASIASAIPAPADDRQQGLDTRCCGMLCINALPATLTELVKPAAPMSLCDVVASPDVAERAPVRHYRPPIA